ncbi:phospholipase D-like domain-containing protein [Pseudobdellovibrio exovorus]|nr:phospholipase D-like domain-containing protein [Pseudobdellovibrio exovorus]
MMGYKNLVRRFFIFGILFLFALQSCTTLPHKSAATESSLTESSPSAVRQTAQASDSITLTDMFRRVREVIAPKEGGKLVHKKVAESELISIFQSNPRRVNETDAALISALESEAQQRDITKHVRLIPPKGQWGYSELKYYVNHPYYKNGKLQRAGNILKVWRDFIQKTEKSLVLNVYDFDLEDVAQDLVQLARRGVKVRVGIDRNVITHRPEVQKVASILEAGGVALVRVNPVALNHQKVAARDWESFDKAAVLFSSGNLTQSCLGPEGDLKNVRPRPRESIPNANHVLTMKSYILSNLVAHELAKTLGPELYLRGAQYPLTGAYQVTGPGVNPQTLEAYPEKSVIITFTPGGGYRAINKNILGHMISMTSGPVRMVQFAYSSELVAEALLQRAQREFQENSKFDFYSVGDTPFAMQGWSQFLKMSGLKREQTEVGRARFYEDSESIWSKNLSASQLEQVRRRVRVAPELYGNRRVRVAGQSYLVSSKIHHKLMSTGDFAVVGTSFNFSKGAETNNEQILVFRDPNMVDMVNGVARYFVETSARSVMEEAQRRNAGLGSTDEELNLIEDAFDPEVELSD